MRRCDFSVCDVLKKLQEQCVEVRLFIPLHAASRQAAIAFRPPALLTDQNAYLDNPETWGNVISMVPQLY